VDFFVRRVEHAGQAATEAGKLDTKFIRTLQFAPGPAGPMQDAWHRIDGLSRGWVLLQWDDALRKHVGQVRKTPPGFPVMLDERPPVWDECPRNWQLLMDIPDPVAGIAALSQGVDAYAEHSAEVAAAAQAVLDRGRQD
jgi:hypothetical protein